ncbi:phosphopantetheine-binding protein [Streptomyces sp. NRRL S-337]|uniref:phosphopantetheine-binding protein n=1 Tax=Streptomyces sp. NRRL S-337 TaxID=1463900 RepID=UPI0004C5F62B|nr:phosphopantetheine-binding protein [Streptomyces sp. NRRL S-337]
MSEIANDQRVETWLIGVCQELGLKVTTAEDDFFAAGGTSLSAVKLIDRAEEVFGEDALPPDDLFAESSIRAVASVIQRNQSRPAPLTGS